MQADTRACYDCWDSISVGRLASLVQNWPHSAITGCFPRRHEPNAARTVGGRACAAHVATTLPPRTIDPSVVASRREAQTFSPITTRMRGDRAQDQKHRVHSVARVSCTTTARNGWSASGEVSAECDGGCFSAARRAAGNRPPLPAKLDSRVPVLINRAEWDRWVDGTV